jgi:hypothetical protein
MQRLLTGILFSLITAPAALTVESIPADVGDPQQLGRGIQRTMTLLASSTPTQRNTVRILFYGQSITEQTWSKLVTEDLKNRFPSANLIIENRALGGFSSQRLVKTAETDLYDFNPDLLIFHVYGAHDDYERIIERTRQRTTAEILIQTDHVGAKDDWQEEETDPAKIGYKHWASFMNYKHLPAVITRYGCGSVDQRNLWKKHLTATKQQAQALLKDNVHLNDLGCEVMAAFAKAALVKRTDTTMDPMQCGYVRTYNVGKDVPLTGGQLTLSIDGNRIDVIAGAKMSGAIQVRIDGKAPSQNPALYGFTKALGKPGGKWPVVANLSSEAPLLLETWTLNVARDPQNEKRFTFDLVGSKTGADGSGASDVRFVSTSRRIVIDPEDWDVTYALNLSGIKTIPDKLTARWEVVPRFVDSWTPNKGAANLENSLTVAHDMNDGPHELVLTGDVAGIQAIRVYAPKAFPCPAQTK